MISNREALIIGPGSRWSYPEIVPRSASGLAIKQESVVNAPHTLNPPKASFNASPCQIAFKFSTTGYFGINLS